MLILFDIDGTLLRSQGVGVRSMERAARLLFGDHLSIEGIEVAGRLDVLIWRDLATRHGIDPGAENHARFRSTYRRMLEQAFDDGAIARALPGVMELVRAVAEAPDLTAGVLTGNYRETGRMKIDRAGLDPDVFVIEAWGDEGATRRDLPPVAMNRYAARNGGTIDPNHVVIIGDTPHDVDCARHHGCRSLGVATGVFSVDDLRRSGADRAVASLAEVDDILTWLRDGSG